MVFPGSYLDKAHVFADRGDAASVARGQETSASQPVQKVSYETLAQELLQVQRSGRPTR